MRIKLIVNPSSGKTKVKRYLPTIEKMLSKENWVERNFTSKSNDAFNFTYGMNPDNFDLIVIAGGDGTLNGAINGMLKANYSLPIGFIPLGTSNVFALCSGIPFDPVEACNTILKRRTKRVDLGKINSEDGIKYFTFVAGTGFDSLVVKEFNWNLKKIFGGVMAHVFSAIYELAKLDLPELNIEADGTLYKGYQVIISNGKYYGVSSVMAPEADMFDGYLDLVIFKNNKKRDLIKYFLALGMGKHTDLEDVKYFKAKNIKVESKKTSWVQIDGEIGGKLPQKFSVVSGGLEVILP
ncbi:MAG: diacylglycerol/lipid kinase family protein [Candidatus Aminicenantia bacterium]